MGIEEDVSGILHEDGAIKVWLPVSVCIGRIEREHIGGSVPEKQMIFRLVVRFSWFWVGEKLVRGTDKSLWTLTSGRAIAEGAIVAGRSQVLDLT